MKICTSSLKYVMLFVVGGLALASCNNQPVQPAVKNAATPIATSKVDTPIVKPPFKLTKRKFGRTPWYNAVVPAVNPAKDDYKTLCKKVAKAAIEQEGSDMLLVVIYDNEIAMEMYEGINMGHIMTKEEYGFVNDHAIAMYDGRQESEEWGESYVMHYYGESKTHKKFKSKEKYKP